jgi:DNA polymerase-3 subunit epsilon
MNEIFLDTETTGLSPKDGDRILEIACIETKDLIPTKKIFHKLINPERKVSQEAFKVHGFSNDFLQDKQKFKDIAEELLEFIDGKKLIIHNAPFDIGFLNSELKKINKKVLDVKKVDDTLSLARSKFPASSNSLDNLCKRFNIDISRRTKHNALLDCELLREVYINLVGQKEPSLLFSANDNPEENKISVKNIRNREKIVIEIDPEEIKKHNNFLKSNLKKNFF